MAPKFIKVEPRTETVGDSASEPLFAPIGPQRAQELLLEFAEVLSAVPVFYWLGLWALLINFIAFALMRSDKRRARLGLWRVSEQSLLAPAFMGGALGGKLAQRRFRHKTRKQPFARRLNRALALNALAYGGCGWLLLEIE